MSAFEYDGRRQRGSDKAMALDLYTETLPGCPQTALHPNQRECEAAHRFVYGQLVCFGCGKPVEAALAEQLAAAERVVAAARRFVGAQAEGHAGLIEDAHFQLLRALTDYPARGGDA